MPDTKPPKPLNFAARVDLAQAGSSLQELAESSSAVRRASATEVRELLLIPVEPRPGEHALNAAEFRELMRSKRPLLRQAVVRDDRLDKGVAVSRGQVAWTKTTTRYGISGIR